MNATASIAVDAANATTRPGSSCAAKYVRIANAALTARCFPRTASAVSMVWLAATLKNVAASASPTTTTRSRTPIGNDELMKHEVNKHGRNHVRLAVRWCACGAHHLGGARCPLTMNERLNRNTNSQVLQRKMVTAEMLHAIRSLRNDTSGYGMVKKSSSSAKSAVSMFVGPASTAIGAALANHGTRNAASCRVARINWPEEVPDG